MATLFGAGKDFRDVVIALRRTPERIRQLQREYALGSDLVLPAPIRCEIEQMGYFQEGHRLTPPDVLRIIKFLAEKNAKLIQKIIDLDQLLDRNSRVLALEREKNAQKPSAARPSTRTNGPPRARSSPRRT